MPRQTDDTPPPPPAPLGSAAARWDDAYRLERAPWDIGQAQPAFVHLADAGEMASPVLDCGCGTGEHALMLAARGLTVLGVDIAPSAIGLARRKATERRLQADFRIADALALDRLGRHFATVIDSGFFHTLSDDDRPRYLASMGAALQPGGVLHLLCFSELTPGEDGPRRVTQDEIRETFARGWNVERILPQRFEVAAGFSAGRPHAWLARIVRGPLP